MSYTNMPGVLLCGRRQEESSCRESESELGYPEGQFFPRDLWKFYEWGYYEQSHEIIEEAKSCIEFWLELRSARQARMNPGSLPSP